MAYGKWPWEIEDVGAVRYRAMVDALLDDAEYQREAWAKEPEGGE